MKRKLFKKRKMLIIVIVLPLAFLLGGCVFLHTPSFGRLPSGKRLERIRRSPNYIDGEFRYPVKTEVMTSSKSGLAAMWEFVTQPRKDTKPSQPVPSEKTDLLSLSRENDCIVWFGHSSYLLQIEGKRLLVDPVFYKAAPVRWVNKPYPGTDLWRPSDMPPCDWLLISHDHWDHLDYQAVTELKNSITRVLLPLGVGEHFERWGFPETMLTELDWQESADLGEGFAIHCLPARHFSGRGLCRNKALWASFLLKTPSGRQIYIGGDSGYGPHFKEIGDQFPKIDLAILENGQYNKDWAQIHTLPSELPQVCRDLGAKEVITVHHSKYTLSKHPWDEPRRNEDALEKEGITVRRLIMGKPEMLWTSLSSGETLYRIAEIEVLPEYLEAYLAAARDVGAESVAKEPGVLCIFPMRMKESPNVIRILEIYKDEAAYKAHLASPHFRKYKEGTPHMIKSLRLVPMTPLDAEHSHRIFRKQ